MSYQIFARKFRPQNFDEVVGQEPITRTLQNAIKQERIPQSFLFSGPRGVGKTSTARILAKSLNCEKGPVVKPCDKCTSCTEITAGNSMDVLEIDGASNRGIDEIRNLRETVRFKPSHGRYKIYIIDEVHMLTTEAFNALLKTLEEPPVHVKFIFATTESHKVPLTILSRCQRFNFKRITVAETMAKLEDIAKKEKLKFEPNALFLIAKASDGGLRDAESLLDQLATFSKDKIQESDVLFMLGLASENIYFEVLSALRQQNVARVFEIIAQLYNEGIDLIYFAKGLLELFRHLLLYQCTENADTYSEWSESASKEFKKVKNDFSRGELLLSLSILQNLQSQLRRNMAPPKLLLETTLLKLAHLDGLRSLDEESISEPMAYIAAAPTSGPKPIMKIKDKTVEPASLPLNPEAPVKKKLNTDTEAITLTEAEAYWPRVIEYVKTQRMSTGIFLSESEPVEIDGGVIVLGLPSELQFHQETLQKDNNRKLVEDAFEIVSSKKVRVQFVITKRDIAENGDGKAPAPAAPETDTKMPEIIEEAMNIFQGARIVRKD